MADLPVVPSSCRGSMVPAHPAVSSILDPASRVATDETPYRFDRNEAMDSA